MRIEEIAKREGELILLCTEAKEASKAFAEAVQFAAMKADTTPAVVRRYIAALASDKANEVGKETEQLVILFASMPTLSATRQVAA